jgi:hypothetical protein
MSINPRNFELYVGGRRIEAMDTSDVNKELRIGDGEAIAGCRSTLDGERCCRSTGHDGHHEAQHRGNRFGWIDTPLTPSGSKIRVAICAGDSPGAIACNVAAVIKSNAAPTVARSPKFYGSQPAVLPETLPAGVMAAGYCALNHQAVLSRTIDGRPVYLGEWWSDRAGYVQVTFASDIDWSTVPIQEGADITPIHTQADADKAWGEGSTLAGVVGGLLKEARLDSPTCRDCSSPTAPGPLDCCAYCAHREYGLSEDDVRRLTDNQRGQAEARARMLRADARERPRSTASSRELARAHPWECSGEDEP